MTPYDLITALSESRNRDYANGQPVRSPAGALFSMQVMPATARDPGFGIRPAQNSTPDEYNRVGRDYLSAMQSRYGGDPAKMWAAYNAGPARVDQALKQGPNWLSALPTETQSYVQNNMAKLAKEQQPEPDPQRAANFSVDIPQMEQPSFGDQPLSIASNSILGNLPQLKAPSNRGKTIGAILGTLGDALMAYGGLRPEFAPYLAQQQQDAAENDRANQRLQAEIDARKQALLTPRPTQTDRYIAQIMDPNTPPQLKAILRQVVERPIAVPTYNSDGSQQMQFYYPDSLPGSQGGEDDWEYSN